MLVLALLSALAVPGDLQLRVAVEPPVLTIAVENAATPRSVAITVPAGYAVVTPAPGTVIGTVRGQAAKIGDVHSLVLLDGQITAAAPDTADACDAAPHRAVWQVQLRQGDTFPVFVDESAGSFVIRYCPPLRSDGGRIFQLVLTLRGVFTSPTARGTYQWSVAVETSTMATYEANAIVFVPNRLILRARIAKGVLVVTGRVDRPRVLQVLLTARRRRRLFSAVVRTNAHGVLTYRRNRVRGPLTLTAISATQSLSCSEPCLSWLVMPPPPAAVSVR